MFEDLVTNCAFTALRSHLRGEIADFQRTLHAAKHLADHVRNDCRVRYHPLGTVHAGGFDVVRTDAIGCHVIRWHHQLGFFHYLRYVNYDEYEINLTDEKHKVATDQVSWLLDEPPPSEVRQYFWREW